MRKIFESDYHCYDNYPDSASKIHLFEITDEDEYFEFEEMTFEQKCMMFNVMPTPYEVIPGAKYYEYDFYCTGDHFVMVEIMAYNI